jgi:hypothetical protein
MMRFSRLDAPPLVAIWDAEIQQLIVGDTAGHLNWIDWETAQIQRRVMLVDDWITALAMSLDGNTLYVGTANGELWRVPISRDVPNAKQLN